MAGLFSRASFSSPGDSHVNHAISAGASALLMLGAVWFLYRPRRTQGRKTKDYLAPASVEDLKERWSKMDAKTDDVVISKILVHPIKVRVGRDTLDLAASSPFSSRGGANHVPDTIHGPLDRAYSFAHRSSLSYPNMASWTGSRLAD
jgi:hypothetical protein